MVQLREIQRTATFAWSPNPGLPLIVTGTKSDTLEDSKLELWDLSLDDLEQGRELQPLNSISLGVRFNDIAWAPATEGYPQGIIAAALDDNTLYFWDAKILKDNSGNALIEQGPSHGTSIKAIEFSPYHSEILAAVGGEGQVHIYSVNDIANPSRLDNAQSSKDDLESVAWNRKSENILASGSSTGTITIWDMSKKKELFKIKNSRVQAITAIAWDPESATKLIAANADDGNILLWELKSRQQPEKLLRGHNQAVLSLSWCQQDRDLMLSGGIDDKTICWNPQTGEVLSELPDLGAGRGIFQTRFNPHFPALLATASFDGKIAVHTLQNTNQPADQAAANGAVDGDDFFNQAAQSQLEGASFNLKQAPKWLQRPIGASFGFGGKLVVFRRSAASELSAAPTSTIQISQFSADADIAKAMEEFEECLKSQDIGSICKTRIERAKSDNERADYEAIEALAAPNPRSGVTERLGFAKETAPTAQSQGKGLLLESTGAGKDDDDIFAQLSSNDVTQSEGPFQLLSDSDAASDREISEAVAMGRFEKGVDVCLREGRFLDAFLFAACGGEALVEKVQKAYFSRKPSEGPSYLRVLSAVASKNLADVVQNADLRNWKSTMAIICSYADANEFPSLCEELGDRLLEYGSRKDASFCYIVGSKLEKVIRLWISELQDEEIAAVQGDSGESTFSAHARILQNFVEKVSVFRKAAKFEDKEKNLSADWSLSPLYDRYVEYADILSSNGHLGTAATYLDLLPAKYPAAEVARSRVTQASKVAPAQARQQQPMAQRVSQRVQPMPTPFQPIQSTATNAGMNAYPPAAQPAMANSYAPTSQGYAPQHGYMFPAAQGNLGPQGYQAARGMPQGNGYNQFGAPPQNTTPLPPPPKAKDTSNWNDTPMVTKPSVSRRGTPGMTPAPITSPFPNQTGAGLPPTGPPYGGLVRGTPTPPPPPPKGPAPPRVKSPMNNAMPPFQQPPRPTSTSNAYAPSNPYAPSPLQSGHSIGQGVPPPTVARGPSPYNPPPSGAPPTSRYAPAPSTQQIGQLPGQIAPPPQSNFRPPPANNPYAPQQSSQMSVGQFSQNQVQPHQFSEPQRQMSAPPRATPPTSRPPTGQSQLSRPPAPTAAAAAAAPAAPKYPPGDRSHIPESAQELVNIFSSEMQRISAQAPSQYARRINDTQKRINILFDHLNNGDLVKPDTVGQLTELARALQARNFDDAAKMQADIHKEKTAECGDWMVGVKFLVTFSKATPLVPAQ